jgi:hypothetical protein
LLELAGFRLSKPGSVPGFPSFRSKAEIVALAGLLDIAPGIVAGRYQYLTGKWHLFKGMIRMLQWAE